LFGRTMDERFSCILPASLFGSVAYPEGLFMLLSALALRDFDARRYPASALWSALAALTRPNGVVLCVAFAVSALAERRGKGALLPAVAALLGALVMIAIGAVRFHDPLAFVHAQQAWRHGIGGGFTEWRILLSSGSVSFGHWRLNLYMLPIIALLILAGTRIHWQVGCAYGRSSSQSSIYAGAAIFRSPSSRCSAARL
jgi:hypothetical protein